MLHDKCYASRMGGRLSSQPAVSLIMWFVCFPLLELAFHCTNQKGKKKKTPTPPLPPPTNSHGKKPFKVHRMSKEGVKP